MGRQIALVLALLAGALIAWSQLRPPAPAPADAPETSFSAERAMADVRLLAATPHPTGSTANHAVRDKLRARLDDLGLTVRLRRDDVAMTTKDGGLVGGSAETLVGVLPGRDRSLPTLALMAHYDSVPGAPGAADDGAGVAAAIETVRAIEAKGAPARDVAVVLTDGEEAGLFGARGFFGHDPLARRLGFVINLEARGSGGRALMFETGRRNGATVALFRRAVARPLTGSLFGAVYARMPNDTDFSIARMNGKAGFNWAFAGRAFDYHSPTDTAANLQPGALQDLGDQALAAASAAAFAPQLPGPEPDVVYGVLFGRTMLAYPPAAGWLVLLLAAALGGVGVLRARRISSLAGLEIARGAGAGLYTLAAGCAVLHVAGAAARLGTGPLGATRLLAAAERWEAAAVVLAIGALLFAAGEVARARRTAMVLLPLAAGLASCALTTSIDAVGLVSGLAAAGLALALGRRPVERPAGWAGILLIGLVAATAMQAASPLAAYVLAWPLLIGALGAALTALSADRRLGGRVVLALLAAAVAGWTGVQAHLIFIAAGLAEPLCLPLLMASLALWPLATPPAAPPVSGLAPGRLLLMAGALLVLVVRIANPWDARHPQPSFVAYQLDQDTGRAWRVALPAQRTAWSDAVLQGDGGRIGPFRHWAWPEPMRAAPARPTAVPAPAIALIRGGDGLTAIKLTPPAGARTLSVALAPDSPAQLVGAGTAETALSLPAGRWTEIRWSAPNADGLTLALRRGAPGRLRLRYVAGFDRWPTGVAPPRAPPSGVMGRGLSGEALATGSRNLAW